MCIFTRNLVLATRLIIFSPKFLSCFLISYLKLLELFFIVFLQTNLLNEKLNRKGGIKLNFFLPNVSQCYQLKAKTLGRIVLENFFIKYIKIYCTVLTVDLDVFSKKLISDFSRNVLALFNNWIPSSQRRLVVVCCLMNSKLFL